MDPQEIEVDSVADLRVALDDNVDLDTVCDVAEGEMLPVPEDAVLDVAGDLEFPDASTPSQMTDSLSATAGTSPSRSPGLLDSLSRRMVPSWLGWPGRGSARSDPVVVSGSLGQPRPLYDASVSVRTVDGVPDSARISVQAPLVDTPRFGVVQSQFRQGGKATSAPGSLFGNPLGMDQGTVEPANVKPVRAAPTVLDHSYVDGSLQGTGSAGYVQAGTNVVGFWWSRLFVVEPTVSSVRQPSTSTSTCNMFDISTDDMPFRSACKRLRYPLPCSDPVVKFSSYLEN